MMLNPRVGAYYACGSLLLAASAMLTAGWGLTLLWPAASCAVAATGYFGAGPRIYRKVHGRVTVFSRVVMAPVLLGQRLSLSYYRRQGRAWDEAAPRLLMGRLLGPGEAATLLAGGVTAVLDLTAEFSETDALRRVSYCNLPVLDLTAPTATQLRQAVAFIREGAAAGAVYVHCKVGYSRTAAAVGAYLMAAGNAATADAAVAQLRAARSPIVIRPEVVEALRAFEHELAAGQA